MSPYYFLSSGILFGIIRTAVEYDSWPKQKYNSIWFAIAFVLSSFVMYISESDFYTLILFILGYWNAFELSTNISHSVEVFRVGNLYYFDKLLRKVSPYYYSYVKFILHILSIVVIMIILCL